MVLRIFEAGSKAIDSQPSITVAWKLASPLRQPGSRYNEAIALSLFQRESARPSKVYYSAVSNPGFREYVRLFSFKEERTPGNSTI